ncbi:BCCT family transporter [Desulfosporosinus nitroreducens]|uniref:BCCT family transporter n=2 Tax=Desulfosporosinus nitroreducens TaxID=2018668 RepID=A0ABT8QXA1_9FIRM|nr:BCCT family transporter [Desulfosporosinus nitroreducens]MDO0825973.1 BCCT family transporter [Desulfosporosinus nitroreducens]
MLIVGPTRYILNGFSETLGNYLQNIVQMSFAWLSIMGNSALYVEVVQKGDDFNHCCLLYHFS